MNQIVDEQQLHETLEWIIDALDRSAEDELRGVFRDLHPAEVAFVLEALPGKEREAVWGLIDAARQADVLSEAEDSVRASHMLHMEPQVLAGIANELDDDDAADMLQDLPAQVIEEVLQAMDQQERERLQIILAFPEDTAGGLMNTDAVTVRADVSLEVVTRYLRRRGEIPQKTNRLFVVDRENRYQGQLRLADLLVNEPETPVEKLMTTELPGIPSSMSVREVARLFEQRDLISAPVVDEYGRLLGRITVDDVMDVIRDEGERSLMSMAGLGEEDDMFAPVLASSRRRAVWLGINLGTALLASWVIGLFEATIQEIVALAVLMPVVASMGGVAGSQTLTIIIRGMALGQVGASNIAALMMRELAVASVNSMCWAVVVGLVALIWFGNPGLGVVVGVAMVVNLLFAALAGASIPLLLRRLHIDPALAGGVILTTVTDVIGFVTFLGLGSLFLTR